MLKNLTLEKDTSVSEFTHQKEKCSFSRRLRNHQLSFELRIYTNLIQEEFVVVPVPSWLFLARESFQKKIFIGALVYLALYCLIVLISNSSFCNIFLKRVSLVCRKRVEELRLLRKPKKRYQVKLDKLVTLNRKIEQSLARSNMFNNQKPVSNLSVHGANVARKCFKNMHIKTVYRKRDAYSLI